MTQKFLVVVSKGVAALMDTKDIHIAQREMRPIGMAWNNYTYYGGEDEIDVDLSKYEEVDVDGLLEMRDEIGRYDFAKARVYRKIA